MDADTTEALVTCVMVLGMLALIGFLAWLER